MFLFITKFLAGDVVGIQKEVYVLFVPYVLVSIAIITDLISGLHKARLAGEARTSYGLRRTASKFREYYSVLLIATTIDIILSILEFYNLPWFTFASGAYLCFTEWLSVREKWNDKARRKSDKDLKSILKILENRSDLAKLLNELLKNKEEEKPQE